MRGLLILVISLVACVPGAGSELSVSGDNSDFYDSTLAFPGAEGFGANATGGRGGDIVFITNRNDSGPGSARAAFEQEGKRYIIPLVWGYVDLDNGIRASGNFTYAGQFMPNGQGLVLRNNRQIPWEDGEEQSTLSIGRFNNPSSANDNVILRYLKIYRGVQTSYPDQGSGLSITSASNVIVDHSVIAFTNDEVIEIWGSDTQNISIQHTWPIYPLHFSTHPKTLEENIQHGFGILAGGGATQVTINRAFFNLNYERVPRISGQGQFDVVNNYLYNVNGNGQIQGASNSRLEANWINTLWEPGPLSQDRQDFSSLIWVVENETRTIPALYLEGNLQPRTSRCREGINCLVRSAFSSNVVRPVLLSDRVNTPPVRTVSASEAKEEILTWGGPSHVRNPLTGELRDVRDELLQRAVNEARRRTGPSRAFDNENHRNMHPNIPSGGISEDQFWDSYFKPWRDEHYPEMSWEDYVDGYQVIEHFLNAWVPDFPNVSF